MVEKKLIAGIPCEKVPCMGCKQLIWLSTCYGGKGFCNDCSDTPKVRKGVADKTTGVDIRYHGEGV